MSKSEQFYLPGRVAWSICFTCVWIPVLLYIYDVGIGFDIELVGTILTFIAMSLIGIWYISVISISKNGIVLYRINRLVWSDIMDAKLLKVFGLRHVLITRKKGMSCYLPLYFFGKKSVIESLISNVPEGNPLYEAAREGNST